MDLTYILHATFVLIVYLIGNIMGYKRGYNEGCDDAYNYINNVDKGRDTLPDREGG